MPRHYEGPAQNYHNVDHFKETAIKTLNNLFGRKKSFEIFDFSESEKDGLKYYHAVAYYDHETAPKEQQPGEELSDEQKEAVVKKKKPKAPEKDKANGENGIDGE